MAIRSGSGSAALCVPPSSQTQHTRLLQSLSALRSVAPPSSCIGAPLVIRHFLTAWLHTMFQLLLLLHVVTHMGCRSSTLPRLPPLCAWNSKQRWRNRHSCHAASLLWSPCQQTLAGAPRGPLHPHAAPESQVQSGSCFQSAGALYPSGRCSSTAVRHLPAQPGVSWSSGALVQRCRSSCRHHCCP